MTEKDLPPGWARATLGEIGQWYGGGTPSKGNPEFWTDGTVPWLSPKDMGPDMLVATQDHITEAAVEESATKLVPAGSVALVVRSGVLEHSVPIAYVPFATTLNQDMKAIVPGGGINPRWLAWTLRALEQTILKDCRKAGTTVASISTVALQALPIPVPPMAEQERIVDALEDHLSRLDSGKAYLRSSIARVPEARASWIHSMLRNGKANSDWQTVRIGDIAKVGTGSTPKKAHSEYYENGDIPWVTSSQIKFAKIDHSLQYVTDLALKETSLRLFPQGTILVAMYGEGKTRGKSAELGIAATTNQACAAIVLSREFENHKPWLKIILESKYDELRKLAAGGVQPNLNLGIIRNIEVPLPPVREQAVILDDLDRITSMLEHLGDRSTEVHRRMSGLRASLIESAYSGKLVEQDAFDELAFTLLERIRAERETQGKPKRGRRPSSQKSTRAAPPVSSGDAGTFVQEELGA